MNRHQEQLEKPYRPYLPSDSAMRRRLLRSRRKEQPALPKSLAEVDIQGKTFKAFKA